MINAFEVIQTINMIKEENLDIRTITMGISLLDCCAQSTDDLATKIYDKVCFAAKDLVAVGDDIASRFGIPIINKRISVTPISIVGSGKNCIKLARALDRAASTVGVNFIGGYTAFAHKGYGAFVKEFIFSIPEALSVTQSVCSSVSVATTRAGINMQAVSDMGYIIKQCATLTADQNFMGAAKLVVFANPVEDNPFMAGAYHGVGEGERVIHVGVSGPGVVKSALQKLGASADFSEIAETIKRTAFKITRVGQLVAQEASKMLNTPFGIVDLSLAPTPAIGDSVADILTEMGLQMCGAPGSTAALALLNDAVKKGGVMASSSVGGLSGAFIPVSEDAGMICAAASGALTIEKLEAMTAVCSVGLDMIAIPGDTPNYAISGILADEMAIGVVNNKTTAIRLIPAIGKKAGEFVDFGGLFGSAPIMPVSEYSCENFIARMGQIPPPLHSLRN